MQYRLIWILAMCCIGASSLFTTTGCSRQDRRLNLLPHSTLEELSLKKRELPRGYAAITDSNLLAQAGLRTNPGYHMRRADRETMVRVGAAASFLALYGHEETVRLMVKGLFFQVDEDAVKYADVQETRQRQVAAYRRDTRDGIWLLFLACDPELTYDEAELAAIRKGLQRYQRRLSLEPLFDQLNDWDAN